MPEVEAAAGEHPSVVRYVERARPGPACSPDAIEGRIVNGEAVAVLSALPSGCVDLVHTSPPYNIDRPYELSPRDRGPADEYAAFLREVIGELRRVVRPGGSIFWQTGYTQDDETGREIIPIDFLSYDFFRAGPDPVLLWDRIVWRYWGGHAFRKKFTNKHETILWFVKPGAEPTFSVDAVRERAKEYDKRNNFWGRNPGNVWEVDRVAFGSTEQTSHVAVFPEELSERIIRSCSNEGDLVLDPFSGSGTAPKVARGLGRRWIGIELSPVYAAESAVRIGFQQPSERDSLASELMKTALFNRRTGRRTIAEACERLRAWIEGARVAQRREAYEADVAAVFHDGNGRNDRKRDVWARYDALIGQGSVSGDPVVAADALLLSCYKLRRRLNGVSRYRSALEALARVEASLLDGDAEAYVRRVAGQEPSSFHVGDGVLELRSDRKVVALAAGTAPLNGGSPPDDGDSGQADDSFQAKML